MISLVITMLVLITTIVLVSGYVVTCGWKHFTHNFVSQCIDDDFSSIIVLIQANILVSKNVVVKLREYQISPLSMSLINFVFSGSSNTRPAGRSTAHRRLAQLFTTLSSPASPSSETLIFTQGRYLVLMVLAMSCVLSLFGKITQQMFPFRLHHDHYELAGSWHGEYSL